MKIKTLLFGAGAGSLRFIENTKNERHFIAYLDNSTNKAGTTFGNLPVHLPTDLRLFDYDEIVITTQWALEVKEQLLTEYQIEPEKIVLPPKKLLKNLEPFKNPRSLKLAEDIIQILSGLAIKADIPLVVDFGTLLGIVRDGHLIPWDDDVDLSVPYEYAEQVHSLLRGFVEEHSALADWCLAEVKDGTGITVGLWLQFNKNDTDLTEFTTSICFRRNVDGYSQHMASLGMWYAPQGHFESTTSILWKGQEIMAPCDPQRYLSFVYKEWQTPVKNIDLGAYANLNKVDFENVENARIQSSIAVGEKK